jgi:hypothetical protein
VRLVAVNVQAQFDTGLAIKSSVGTPPALGLQGSSKFKFNADKPLEFRVVASVPVESVDEVSASIVTGVQAYSGSRIVLRVQPDKKTIVVTLTPGPPVGTYTMTIPVSTKAGEKAAAGSTIGFEVVQ